MRFNNRATALLGIPDLPLNAFQHCGDRRIKPQGGGIPIVSDVVDAVGDVVGDVVDTVVDVVVDIPVVGEIADDQLGLDPNGGGMVPYINAGITGAILAPVGGAIGGALNTGLGMSLGAGATQALGSAALSAAAGGTAQSILGSAVGGYLSGSGALDRAIDATTGLVNGPNGWGFGTTYTFDDGSTLSVGSDGRIVSGVDIDGRPFEVHDGVGSYSDNGAPLAGTPETNFGGNLADPSDVNNLLDYNVANTTPIDPTVVTEPGYVDGVLSNIPEYGVGAAVVDAVTPEVPTPPGSLYEGQTFTPVAPGERWSRPLANPGLNPGWMMDAANKPFYDTTSDVQSQFYWGKHPYAATEADLANYNNIPEAPSQPWGLKQGFWEQPNTSVPQQVWGENMTPIVPQVAAQPAAIEPNAVSYDVDQTTGQLLPGQLPPWLMLDDTGMGVIPNPSYSMITQQ